MRKSVVRPDEATHEAIVKVVERKMEDGIPETTESLSAIVAALGQSAARIMASMAIIDGQGTDELRHILVWFAEQVETDALKAYHNAPERRR